MSTLSDVPSPTARGFTLLELACVVAIISALTSIAVPSFRVYRDRAFDTEATVNVETIAYLEQVAILERGAPVACPPNPAAIPAPLAAFADDEAWQALGFRPEGRVRHQYEVVVDGDDFLVRARGDLDQDGVHSEHVVDSKTMSLLSKRPGA